MESNCDFNPLIIIEDEIPPKNATSDNSDDNESNSEIFDFSDSEISALENVGSEVSTATNRNSLLIIEEKDLMMADDDDYNNNNSLHRLSLQIESGDENSLVMTNEAINRTIIRIGSNGSSVDFGEQMDSDAVANSPHEAINQEINDKSARRNSENHPDDGEAIVSILGQINDIVGYNNQLVSCSMSMSSMGKIPTGVGGFIFCYR